MIDLVEQVMNDLETNGKLLFVINSILKGNYDLRHQIRDLEELTTLLIHELRIVKKVILYVIANVRYFGDVIGVVFVLKVLF